MRFDGLNLISLVGPGGSPNMGLPTVQGHTSLEESEVEAEQLWDACESASLKTKELEEQVTKVSRIYLARR